MWNDFTQQFWSSTIDGLTNGSIYALIALGYTLVYGVLRLINFAHSEIFMIGTVATLFTVTHLGIAGPLGGIGLVGVSLVPVALPTFMTTPEVLPLTRLSATTLPPPRHAWPELQYSMMPVAAFL